MVTHDCGGDIARTGVGRRRNRQRAGGIQHAFDAEIELLASIRPTGSVTTEIPVFAARTGEALARRPQPGLLKVLMRTVLIPNGSRHW